MSEVKYRQLRRSAADNIPATVGRLFSYLNRYRIHLFIVVLCIIIDALVNVASSAFFTPLLDNYIVPLIGQKNPDLSGFINQLTIMGIVFLTGIIAGLVNKKLMSIIATGTLHNMRTDLFRHMQNMSVSFYDSHTHGELMNY